MRLLSTRVLESGPCYDGTPLAPHWIYRSTGILGDALVAWSAPAQVALTEMVDLEDVRAEAPIASPEMLHFLGEWFFDSLDLAIGYQLLLVVTAKEALESRGIGPLRRRGNDLYFDGRKVSVSIATRSPVSVLVHFGINVRTEGTPVPTAGLREWDVDPADFAADVLARYRDELERWHKARAKVLPR
jgi:hypothetical protein